MFIMNIVRYQLKMKITYDKISKLSDVVSTGIMRSLSTNTSNNQTHLKQYETLSLSVPQPFVYHVELNKPSKRNAISHTMWLEIKNCFETLSEDENCRSVVLSGSGPFFCAGIDLQCFMDIGQNFKETDDVVRKCKTLYQTIKLYQQSLTAIEKCVKPVLSAVQGGCIGGAISMICAADLRYCTSDAWFQIKEIDIGMAVDIGAIQRLPKIVGSGSLVRELLFTGRKLLAEEAKECGLVSKIFNSKEEMIENSIKIASEIASKSPVAVQTCKKNLLYSQDHSVDDGLEHIAILNQTMLQSEDLMIALMASVTKSKESPVFSKL